MASEQTPQVQMAAYRLAPDAVITALESVFHCQPQPPGLALLHCGCKLRAVAAGTEQADHPGHKSAAWSSRRKQRITGI